MSNIIYSFNKNFIIFTFHMQHQRSNAHETQMKPFALFSYKLITRK